MAFTLTIYTTRTGQIKGPVVETHTLNRKESLERAKAEARSYMQLHYRNMPVIWTVA